MKGIAMKRITVALVNGKTFDYACNEANRGLFIWNPNNCNWEQIKGTYQTPKFRDYKHLRRYLGYGIGFRMVSHFGW